MSRTNPETMSRRPNKRSGTRERILESCRLLFNEDGPDGVTTARIAASLGINEGNLYYHFRRKEEILEALFERFADQLVSTAAAFGPGHGGPDAFRDYLGGWFRIMWEWRFFYRDGAAIFRLAPALRPRLRAVSDEGLSLTRQAVEEMQAAGYIRIERHALDMAIVNAWIVATYWIDHLRSRHGIEAPTREEIDRGAAQVLALFAPYLTPAGESLTRNAGETATPKA